MPLPFAVLFERIRHSDRSITEELPAHGFNGRICSLKRIKTDESEAAGRAIPPSPSLAILAERTLPNDLKVSISMESSTIGSKFPTNRLAPTSKFFLSAEAFVDFKRPAVQFDAVQRFTGVIGVGFAFEVQ